MQPRIENVLRLAMTIISVESILRDICAIYGEVVGTRVMFTRQELVPRQITAIVEMKQTVALDIAFAHGAQNLGTRLVVFRYDAPDGFQFEDQTGPPERRLDTSAPSPDTARIHQLFVRQHLFGGRQVARPCRGDGCHPTHSAPSSTAVGRESRAPDRRRSAQRLVTRRKARGLTVAD